MRGLKGKAKAQAAWASVRRRSSAFDVLDNPSVKREAVDPEAGRAFVQYDAALRAVSRQIAEPDPLGEQASCPTHQWVSPRRTPGQPPAPASFCPWCRAEQQAPKPTGPEVPINGSGLAPRQMTPQQEALYEKWKTKERARGVRFPGDREHDDAINRMDAERPEVIRREHTPRGRQGMRLVYSNPFSGREVWVPVRKRKRGQKQLSLLDPSARLFVDLDE